MSDFRPNAIYVRRITRKALFYIPLEPDQTIDGLCDKIVFDWVVTNHPKVILHLTALDEMDEGFKKEYQAPKPPF